MLLFSRPTLIRSIHKRIIHERKRLMCMKVSVNSSESDVDTNAVENDCSHVTIYDTFSKQRKLLLAHGQPISLANRDCHVKLVSMYCCGPTVYDDSHLGHALTYIKCDMIRKLLFRYFNVRVLMAMGITDLDDKILHKARESNASDFRMISNKYFASFMRDLESLKITPPDCLLPVTHHIQDIIHFIQRLRSSQFAYINQEGDINFDSQQFCKHFGLSKFHSNEDTTHISERSKLTKKNPQDFTLWKAAKEGEPSWIFEDAISGRKCPGRPGWHVECSAMASLVFGSHVDLHFGGIDLIFPHHHSEAACCFAYHTNTHSDSQPINCSHNIYDWCDIWLHSGHLTYKSQKMSKSLGNIISIKSFLETNSVNVLRLLCILYHYRTAIELEESVLTYAQNVDKQLRMLNYDLNCEIKKLSSLNALSLAVPSLTVSSLKVPSSSSCASNANDRECNENKNNYMNARSIEREIVLGIADDFDLNRGLRAILNLCNSFGNSSPSSSGIYNLSELIAINSIIANWCDAMGLTYTNTLNASNKNETNSDSFDKQLLTDMLVKFRFNAREIALKSLKAAKVKKAQTKDLNSNTKDLNSNTNGDKSDTNHDEMQNAIALLSLCDQLRSDLNDLGFILKDPSINAIVDKNKS